jgi:hypothetical protein
VSTRVLAIALAAQIAVGGAFAYVATQGFPFVGGDGGDGSSGSAGAAARGHGNQFDGARAYADMRRIVAFGPRPAGSPALARTAAWLRARLPRGARYEAVPGGLRNIVGKLPGRRPAVVVAAHYDTKDIPGFVGANDGAAAPAVMLELVRALRRTGRRPGAPELRFVLFDGEEDPAGSTDFLADGIRGSRAYAAAHARELRSLVLLDFVGNRNLSLPRENASDPALWARLRAAARRVGVARVFPPYTRGEIYDDHTPFVRAGVPSIDLIDFDYACFHRTCDRANQISRRSLDAVGESVLELLRGL